MTVDTASHGRSWPVAGDPRPSSSISFGVLTLVMAVACGVAAATIYCNQPMLGIMEAAFPGEGRSGWARADGNPARLRRWGSSSWCLLGRSVDRRRLIVLQMTALAISLVAAALAPDASALVAISALVGITASVAQQIVPFAAELAEPSRRGATIGTVMSGLLCGMLLGRVVAGGVADHYGWRAVYWLALLLVAAAGCLLAATLPRSRP